MLEAESFRQKPCLATISDTPSAERQDKARGDQAGTPTVSQNYIPVVNAVENETSQPSSSEWDTAGWTGELNGADWPFERLDVRRYRTSNICNAHALYRMPSTHSWQLLRPAQRLRIPLGSRSLFLSDMVNGVVRKPRRVPSQRGSSQFTRLHEEGMKAKTKLKRQKGRRKKVRALSVLAYSKILI